MHKYDVDLAKVIDAATDARVRQIESAITDERETLSHSTWLASVALALIPVAIAIFQDSSSVCVNTLRILTVLISVTSLLSAAKLRSMINGKINLYHNLITAALALRTQLLSESAEITNIMDFTGEIYELKAGSNQLRSKTAAVEEDLKKRNIKSSVQLCNFQLKILGVALALFLLQVSTEMWGIIFLC